MEAGTAGDLMTINPVSVDQNVSVPEAIALLMDRGFSAAPVIDEAGRPVGVISRTDVLVHTRERMTYPMHPGAPPPADEHVPDGFELEEVDSARVADIMTPIVFSVTPDTPAMQVIRQMRELHVHQLYVVDKDQVLVGVITAVDVLRHLRPEGDDWDV